MELKTAKETGLRTATPPVPKHDEMPLLGIDHLELYVGNGIQAAHYFTHALGFRETAFAGLETGMRDRACHLLEQGRIRSCSPPPSRRQRDRPPHRRARRRVKTVALSVPDAEEAYRVAVRRGARGLIEPHEESDEHGTVRLATIATYGETVHTFVQRDGYEEPSCPASSGPTGERPPTTSPGSTTSSATSSSAEWRSGLPTTSGSSASPR